MRADLDLDVAILTSLGSIVVSHAFEVAASAHGVIVLLRSFFLPARLIPIWRAAFLIRAAIRTLWRSRIPLKTAAQTRLLLDLLRHRSDKVSC